MFGRERVCSPMAGLFMFAGSNGNMLMRPDCGHGSDGAYQLRLVHTEYDCLSGNTGKVTLPVFFHPS